MRCIDFDPANQRQQSRHYRPIGRVQGHTVTALPTLTYFPVLGSIATCSGLKCTLGQQMEEMMLLDEKYRVALARLL